MKAKNHLKAKKTEKKHGAEVLVTRIAFWKFNLLVCLSLYSTFHKV